MKKFKDIILLVVCIVLVFGIYAFSSKRHGLRTLKEVSIRFTDYSEPLISEANVNKLLIQNEDSVKNLVVENLDLKESEYQLEQHAMIRTAEVSVTLDGLLEAVVEQRKPVARLMGEFNAYLDQDNSIMPLSEEYSAHVPLVFGFRESVQPQIFELVQFLRNDELLASTFTQLDIDPREEVTLGVRAHEYKVKLGKVENLPHKMTNYKAFMAKMIKEDRMDQLKTVDLRFENQVVVTKK
ncbi:cell division protein FtsQ/DivIB [Nonlabens xiamenensis]|uniref:cell division protein FtsQ/DivIB n=1 Tax=Nonlabens xiamenensis TaxID=2341043 RepID=UPI001F0BCE47|nr:cell division protein FtsQ/DivIB [Nonlabens xiamenensis]